MTTSPTRRRRDAPAGFPTMDPELAAALPALPRIDFADLAAARAVLGEAADLQLARLADTAAAWEVAAEQRAIPGPDGAPDVPALVFRPPVPGPAPALLWMHGGGFAVGAAALEAPFCAELCARAGAVVISPDYRLAPEDPFPAGLDDCTTVLTHLHDHAGELGLDRDRIGVGGQSAGGGLAVAAALRARDRGEPAVRYLAVESPVLDDRLATPSMRAFTTTPVWTRADAELSWRHYLGPAPTEISPYAAPARAHDLSGLPPTYLSVAELDPLRDEGLAFGARLLEAGISVEMHAFPGTFHRSTPVPSAVSRRFRDEIVGAVARGLG